MSARPAYPNTRQNLVAHLTISFKPLLAAAFDRLWIGGWPIFHVDAAGAGQFQGAVMGLGSERDNEIRSK